MIEAEALHKINDRERENANLLNIKKINFREI